MTIFFTITGFYHNKIKYQKITKGRTERRKLNWKKLNIATSEKKTTKN